MSLRKMLALRLSGTARHALDRHALALGLALGAFDLPGEGRIGLV